MLADKIEMILSAVDYSLDTKQRRHVIGGVLMSISLMFGGLAFTIMTIRNEYEERMKELNE